MVKHQLRKEKAKYENQNERESGRSPQVDGGARPKGLDQREGGCLRRADKSPVKAGGILVPD